MFGPSSWNCRLAAPEATGDRICFPPPRGSSLRAPAFKFKRGVLHRGSQDKVDVPVAIGTCRVICRKFSATLHSYFRLLTAATCIPARTGHDARETIFEGEQLYTRLNRVYGVSQISGNVPALYRRLEVRLSMSKIVLVLVSLAFVCVFSVILGFRSAEAASERFYKCRSTCDTRYSFCTNADYRPPGGTASCAPTRSKCYRICRIRFHRIAAS